jgi:hypothetical protein
VGEKIPGFGRKINLGGEDGRGGTKKPLNTLGYKIFDRGVDFLEIRVK